uniref:Zinc finger protein 263 n=1 Tax=Molossus molossus TaxID=27622 RepID=A0A7J8J5E5_MOLMO|nr:zinc finger protein 263 [Molossus molossus]
METERSPGPRLQELLGPSPKRDPQAVKERVSQVPTLETLSTQVEQGRKPWDPSVQICKEGLSHRSPAPAGAFGLLRPLRPKKRG